jgi:TIR domain
MAFDDLKIRQTELIFELLKAHTSGRYSSEFHDAGRPDGTQIIRLRGINGNEDRELSGFTEGDLLSLLTNHYLTNSQSHNPSVLSLTRKAFEQFHLSQAAAGLQHNMQDKESNIDIFISHSSKDEMVAEALADLLKNALNLPAKKIRCTSVPAYKLEPGASVEEKLRREISESRVFIGLITPESVKSFYVLFELGARWGIGPDRTLIPVLASGADYSYLHDPLKNRNPIRCEVQAEVRDLIDNIASVLNVSPDRQAAYQRLVEDLVKKARPKKDRKRALEGKPPSMRKGNNARLVVSDELEVMPPNLYVLRLKAEGNKGELTTKVRLERVVGEECNPLIPEASLPTELGSKKIRLEGGSSQPVRIGQFYNSILTFFRLDTTLPDITCTVVLRDGEKIYCQLAIDDPGRDSIERWFCFECVSSEVCNVSSAKPPCI